MHDRFRGILTWLRDALERKKHPENETAFQWTRVPISESDLEKSSIESISLPIEKTSRSEIVSESDTTSSQLNLEKGHQVVKWNTYFPSLESASSEQRDFFNYWLSEFKDNRVLDIDGNLSYIFVYLYDVIRQFMETKNLSYLLDNFEKIRLGYGNYDKISQYIVFWISEAYLYLGNYDKAWEFKKGRCGINDIFIFINKCHNISIDGDDLLALSQSNYLTNFGKARRDEISKLATIFLNDFKQEKGINLIEFFYKDLFYQDLLKKDFSRLKEFFQNEDEFNLWEDLSFKSGKSYPRFYERYFFPGVRHSDLSHLKCEEIPYLITVALQNEIKRILRECENTLREEQELPRIGEGWISEAELYHKLCNTFPKEKIVHHGRPSWLNPQHLDIFLPIRNIGIEFQGRQHTEPIEFFGGEEALQKRKKLDLKKKMLCSRNGCKLILVYDGYDFDEIKDEVARQIQESN